MPVAKTAWKIFLPLFLIFLVSWIVGLKLIGGIFLLVSLWVLYFFRDPERKAPEEPGAIVSPADGKLDTLEVVDYPLFPDGKALKLGIFLSIFDVHINRAPLDGNVRETKYQPGRFLSAMNKASSKANENNVITLDTAAGTIQVKQIAGIIARRIVCRLKKGDSVRLGDRIGLICFGSRTEIFLPANTELKVKLGMRVKGGSTILGVLPPDKSQFVVDK